MCVNIGAFTLTVDTFALAVSGGGDKQNAPPITKI